LTIDDGPNPVWTPAVLSVLAYYQVKATFSIVGIHAADYPALVQRIVAAGHGMCNHSMTHPEPFLARSAAQIDDEVVQGTVAIYKATGQLPGVFRSPGGDWNQGVFDSCARLGQTPIDWDVDPQDWRRPGTAVITQKLLAAGPGDILLCHDGGGDRSETVRALQTVLPGLKARGLSFVTL
jgi:peptidoglycan/xylan/chitin deacetylase (PgdA/CDA1 family)